MSVGARPYFRGSLLRWLSMNYEAEYGFSRLNVDGDVDNHHSFHQKLFVTVIPSDIVQLTVGAEHFLTAFSGGGTASLVLLDASAVWRVSSRVRLSLTADNLLNSHSYEYVTYGTLSTSRHTFRIRPRALLLSAQLRF